MVVHTLFTSCPPSIEIPCRTSPCLSPCRLFKQGLIHRPAFVIIHIVWMPTQSQTPADTLHGIHQLKTVLDGQICIVFQGVRAKETSVHDVLWHLQYR